MLLKVPLSARLILLSLVVLLSSSATYSFGQKNREQTDRYSPNPEDLPQKLFQDAVDAVDIKKPQAVRSLFLQAKGLWIEAGESEKAAWAALQIADSYYRGKRFEDALYYCSQAFALTPTLGVLQAATNRAIARIYAALGEYKLAKTHFEKAIALGQHAKDISVQAQSLLDLATLHHQYNEKEQVLKCIGRVQQLNQRQSDIIIKASLLLLIGDLYQKDHQLIEAREAFSEALAIYRESKNSDGKQILSLCALSNTERVAGNVLLSIDLAQQAKEMADNLYRQARTITDKSNAMDLRWRAWLSLARGQNANGESEKALKSYFLAVSYLEGVREKAYIYTDQGALSFEQQRQDPYQEYIALLVKEGQIEEGFLRVQFAKAQTISRLIRAHRLPGVDNQTAAIRELSKAAADLRNRLISRQISETQRARLQMELDEKEYALREARLLSELARPMKKQLLPWSAPASISKVQTTLAQMSGPNKPYILEYYLGTERSFLWLIPPQDGGIIFETLPNKETIKDAVEQYINVIKVRPNVLYPKNDLAKAEALGATLFSMLLGKVIDKIPVHQKLIIVPDGPLHYLPFEALFHGGHYLIEDHEISYLPSSSLLAILEASQSRGEAADKMELLAFGDPTFGPQWKSRAIKAHRARPDDIVRSGRALDIRNLAPLQWARKEIENIASVFPSDKVRKYVGEQSTEDALKHEALRKYNLIHFATHGWSDEEEPSRSCIVFALGPEVENDGFLEVPEIMELDLDCDLVVLSACRTGRGKLYSGEGVVGLSRAFLIAGSRAVVASLWDVNDASTGLFMKDFYEHVAKNESYTAALKKAKLEMLQRGKEKRHPYYWGPFVLIGKP